MSKAICHPERKAKPGLKAVKVSQPTRCVPSPFVRTVANNRWRTNSAVIRDPADTIYSCWKCKPRLDTLRGDAWRCPIESRSPVPDDASTDVSGD